MSYQKTAKLLEKNNPQTKKKPQKNPKQNSYPWSITSNATQAWKKKAVYVCVREEHYKNVILFFCLTDLLLPVTANF